LLTQSNKKFQRQPFQKVRSACANFFASGTSLQLAEGNTWQPTQKHNGHHSRTEVREFNFIYELFLLFVSINVIRSEKKTPS